MKQTAVRAGVVCVIVAILFILATSYFDGKKDYVITADEAVVLSLGDSQSLSNIVLSEKATVEYEIVAKIDKSQNAGNVNATLTLFFANESELKTLSIVSFTLYKDGETTAIHDTVTGAGKIQITDVTETTKYKLHISLAPKGEGERYTAEELAKIGGKMTISFKQQGGEGNV